MSRRGPWGRRYGKPRFLPERVRRLGCSGCRRAAVAYFYCAQLPDRALALEHLAGNQRVGRGRERAGRADR